MAKIAILGFGTVGSGVAEILQANAALLAARAGQPLEIGAILVRSKRTHPLEHLFVQRMEDILQDESIDLVVECMGGTQAAYPYVKQALASGRSVVTSNKELVAEYGAELLELAKQKDAAFLFEASVGGGTPILTPMFQSLAAGRIQRIQGILNGTTNFMLGRMERLEMEFDQALALAQQMGYAEAVDPSDDVDGRDACRKIAILASLAFGSQIRPGRIQARGIRGIEASDMKAARQLGCAIKLIAWAKQQEDQLNAAVEPMLVPLASQLGQVNDVYNGVMVTGEMAGDVMFCGQGAGKLATASAVVADLILALQQKEAVHNLLFWQPEQSQQPIAGEEGSFACYIRVQGLAASMMPRLYGEGELVLDEGVQCSYLTENITAQALEQANRQVQALGGKVALVLRCLE